MPLIKKTRVSGKSIVVTLPSQIIEAYNIKNGDLLEIISVKDEIFLIKKATPNSQGSER